MISGIDNNIKKEGNGILDRSTPVNLDLQDKYSTNFSVFKAPITNKIPYRCTNILEIFETIKSDAYSERTIKLRKFTDPDEAKNFKAYNFEYATFSGTFIERAAHRIIKLSIYICVDLDHIGNSNWHEQVAFGMAYQQTL